MLRDKRLSLDAKALHTYMRTFQDGWKFHSTWLAKQLGISRPKVAKLLKQLLDEGYLDRVKTKGDKGIFLGYDYYIFPVRRELYNKLRKEEREK